MKQQITHAQGFNFEIKTNNGFNCTGNAIATLPNNEYIVCGSSIVDGYKDIYVCKVNNAGDTLFTRSIGGSADDEGYCIKPTVDSGYIIAGYTKSFGSGNADFFLVKLLANGTIDWTRTSGGTLADGSYSVMQTTDNGYLVVGFTSSVGAGGRDMRAVKYNDNGIFQWSQTYGTAFDETGYSVTQTSDGGYIIAGSSGLPSNSVDQDLYVVCADSIGNQIWSKRYLEPGDQIAYSIKRLETNGYVIAGKSNNNATNNFDMLLLKIWEDGDLIWKQTYGSEAEDVAYDVAESKDYSFAIVGSTATFENQKQGYLVRATDHGDMVEEFNYGSSYDDEFKAVCFDENGEIIVTGVADASANTISNQWIGSPAYCKRIVPRCIWLMSCWKFNAPKVGNDFFIFLDGNKTVAQKIEDFVEYCKNAKIQTVVIGNLQDIIRQNNLLPGGIPFSDYPTCNNSADGVVLRSLLKTLISDLYLKAGVSKVLAQWLDQDPISDYNVPLNNCNNNNYIADEQIGEITHSQEILEAFLELNKNEPLASLRFNGLILDYEYFSPKYAEHLVKGDAMFTDDYTWAKHGWDQWQILAADFVNAKGNINHIKYVECYLNDILLTDPIVTTPTLPDFPYGHFDVDNDFDTDLDDSKMAIWAIKNYEFDNLSINYSNRDRMTLNSTINNSPTCFLDGEQKSASQESDQQRQRRRLEILGNAPSGYAVNFSVYLRSKNTVANCSITTSNYSIVGDLLIGQCFWIDHTWPNFLPYTGNPIITFLPEVESYFAWNWFNGFGIENLPFPNNDPYLDYGNTNLYRFDWFQYGLDSDDNLLALSHNALLDANHNLLIPGRAGDINNCVYDCTPLRILPPNSYTILESKNATLASDDFNINLAPNPAFSFTNLTISNYKLLVNSIEIIDLKGRNCTSKFNIEIHETKRGCLINNLNKLTGLFLVKINFSDGTIQTKTINFNIN